MTDPVPADVTIPRVFYFLYVPRGTRLIGRLYFWTYIYLLTKLYELVDSWIIILKKPAKGLTYLHVYHHTIMLIMPTWMYAADYGAIWLLTFINSFVHVIMYLYYGMSALGHKWRLRRYITVIQIIQFGCGLTYFLVYYIGKFLFHADFAGNDLIMFMTLFCDAYFFYLFSDFYKGAYNKKGGAEKDKKDKPAPEDTKKAEDTPEPIKQTEDGTGEKQEAKLRASEGK